MFMMDNSRVFFFFFLIGNGQLSDCLDEFYFRVNCLMFFQS